MARGVAGQLSEFSKPSALAQLPAFLVPGVAEAFSGNVIAGLPKQATGLRDTIKKFGLFSKESGQAVTEAGITDLMGLLAGKEGMAGRTAVRSLRESLGTITDKKPPAGEGPITDLSPEQIAEIAVPAPMRGGEEPILPQPAKPKNIVEPGGGSAVAQGDYDALVAENARRLAEGAPATAEPVAAVEPIVPEGEIAPQPEGTGPQVISTAYKDPETGKPRVPPAEMSFIGHEGVATFHEQGAPKEEQRGFMGIKTEGGPVEFLTREEAAKIAVENGQAPPGTEKLKSEHYQATGEPLYKPPNEPVTQPAKPVAETKPAGSKSTRTFQIPDQPQGVQDIVDIIKENKGIKSLPKGGENADLCLFV
jgi:hypothetical protein